MGRFVATAHEPKVTMPRANQSLKYLFKPNGTRLLMSGLDVLKFHVQVLTARLTLLNR